MSSSSNPLNRNSIPEPLVWAGRTLGVEALNYPLGTICTQMTTDPTKPPLNIRQIAQAIIETHGAKGFFLGIGPRLTQKLIKPLLQGPILTKTPKHLEYYDINSIAHEAITSCILTISSIALNPLEKAVVKMRGGKVMNWNDFFKKGWHGSRINATYSYVYWFSMLASEKKLRKIYIEGSSDGTLSSGQLIKIGVIVSGVITVSTAPFQIAATLKLSESPKYDTLFQKNTARQMFRGSTLILNFVQTAISTTASVYLLHAYNKKN